MLGKDKFEHDLPWVLEYGIGVLRHSLKIGDCAGASMLDVRRYLLEIHRTPWLTAHHDQPRKKRAKADRQSCGLSADN
jgi:hypothetical protein